LHKKNFPYLIRQREGDDNSLGLMKFNFRNKYDVYLHDTNARSLFSRNSRALSHGCVRVQEWNSLAKFLVKQDSVRYHPDTLAAWITRAEKHTVPVKIKTPVYLRYFTAEPTETGIKLFDDIYEDDKLLRNRYFTQRL
jgi:murein L,D-transpeptidase YcbB/YkuD